MSFTDHLNPNGLGESVDVFSTSPAFTHHDLPLLAAFNPAFVITSSGTMLAFAEGRLGCSHDAALKTVLINRSRDLGRTWEGMEALTVPGCHFGPRPYAFVTDGRERIGVLVVHTPYGLNQQRSDVSQWLDQLEIDPADMRPNAACVVIRLISDDDGETWHQEALTAERDPFADFQKKGFWVGVNDFTGTVQTIPSGPHAGRQIVAMLTMGTEWQNRPAQLPGNHLDMGRLGSSLIYTDDGESWHLGGVIADQRGNEAATASIARDGRILMLRRPNGFTAEDLNHNPNCTIGYRMLHTSTDGGETWSAPVFPEGLPYLKQGGRRYDHQCLPSLCARDNTLLTATPSAVDRDAGTTPRTHGVIGYSDDLGVTWRHRLIEAGGFSYATIGPVGDEGLIVMFSRGVHGQEASCLRAFTMDWLRDA